MYRQIHVGEQKEINIRLTGFDMRLTKKLKQSILNHAESVYPSECCGVVVNNKYIECTNIADNPLQQFIINPQELIQAESKGEIQAYVHSHPDGVAEPSVADKVQMELHNKIWIIASFSKDDDIDNEVKAFKPSNFVSPLIGRSYFHSIQDCYTVVQDYYLRELDIKLSDYERTDRWWEHEDSNSLYIDNFKKEGFIQVNDNSIQKHDVILFRLGNTYHVNHAGIFLEDGTLTSEETTKVIGNSLFIHHPYLRKSIRELYSDYWIDRTACILRHKSIIENKK